MLKVNYPEALCGLLHDIGKVVLRYTIRAREGLEPRDESLLEPLENLKGHEEMTIKIAELMGINIGACTYFKEVLVKADKLAAAERGLEEKYSQLIRSWNEIERGVSSLIGKPYTHYITPLLSPAWLALMTGYDKSLGPCRTQDYEAKNVSLPADLVNAIKAIETGNIPGLIQAMSNLLKQLIDKPLWLPPTVLDSERLVGMRALSYDEALKQGSYREILKTLVDTLREVGKVYSKVSRGLVDTAAEVLKFTLLTVPSAVYGAIIPDLSLYSHSKLVSAYSSILSMGYDNFELMVIDARGIQEYISAPIKAKAASRVFRGRSLLAELAGLSIINLVLRLYGNLPYSNVLTLEGGTYTLVVPSVPDDVKDNIKKVIEQSVREHFRSLRGPWFTVAWSKRFRMDSVEFISSVLTREGFMNVLEGLEEELAIAKSLDYSKIASKIDESEIEGFDAITGDTVTREELSEGYGFKVTESLIEYAGQLSGYKLEPEELVSEVTHLSLVAGTSARNLQYVISIYAYRTRTPNGLPEPDNDSLREVFGELQRSLTSRVKVPPSTAKVLYFKGIEVKVGDEVYELNVGLIPMVALGSIHVLVSTRDVIEKPEELAKVVIPEVLEPIKGKLMDIARQDVELRVEARIVNVGVEFVKALEEVRLSRLVAELFKGGVDFYLGTLFTGTYHPVTTVTERAVAGELRFVDLDEYPLIALVKADADYLGEVKKVLAISPTRFTSFSDILSICAIGKVNLRFAARALKGFIKRGPILLYAGGDDVTFYGYWVDQILFLDELYKAIGEILYPISFTSVVAIEKSDYPLLELYLRTVEHLSKAKKEAKGGILFAEISSPRIIACDNRGGRIVKSVQVCTGRDCGEHFQKGWPKPSTPLSTLHSLAKILENLEKQAREKLGELEAYKRELRIISSIAALSDEEIKALAMTGASLDTLYRILKRELALSYVSARHEDKFKGLETTIKNLLGDLEGEVELRHAQGENVKEALLRAMDAKIIIDLILTYLNPFNRV